MAKNNPIIWFQFLAWTFLALVVTSMSRAVAGFFQGSDGTPSTFTLEPISLLIGLGAGALVVGIPAAARSISHRRNRKRGQEQCDDKNLIEGDGASVPGNPVKGISVKGGRNGLPIADDASVPGSPVKGISVKGGRNGLPIADDAMVAGNPIGGLTGVKGGKGKGSK